MYEALVAVEIVVPFFCHIYDSGVEPVAETSNTATEPETTEVSTGLMATTGADPTVNVTGVDVMMLHALLIAQRNCEPLSPKLVVKEYELAVAAEMPTHVEPLNRCHW